MTHYAQINARDFARVMSFRAMNDIHYYLNGVYVEPLESGAVIVATNGHMLAAVHSHDTTVQEAMIVAVTPKFATAVKAASRYIEGCIRVATKASFSEVIGKPGDGATFVKPGAPLIDGLFPDWRKVIPDADKMGRGLPSSYNAKYLQQALDAICGGPALSRYGNCVQFYHGDAERPDASVAILRMANDFLCFVMPAREDIAEPIPSWVRPPAAETPKVAQIRRSRK